MGFFRAQLLGLIHGKLAGSGKFYRDRAESAIAADAQREKAHEIAFPPSPSTFDFRDLGDVVLVSFDDDEATVLNVQAVTKNNPYRWRGKAFINSPIFKHLGFKTAREIEDFLVFVFNFKHVAFDMNTGQMWSVMPGEALSRSTGTIPDERLLVGALSVGV